MNHATTDPTSDFFNTLLVPQLQFIREGDFSEVKGAPALRLVGDVQPIDKEARERVRVIRDSITPDAIVRNFLKGEKVAEPLQYIHAQAHCQRRWLPLWCYAHHAGATVDALINDLRSEVATYPSSRDAMLHRLMGAQSAGKVHPGRPIGVLDKLLAGAVPTSGSTAENLTIANAIMGLPDDFDSASSLMPLILEMLDKAPSGHGVRSAIYRAACRIDEILFKEAVKAKR